MSVLENASISDPSSPSAATDPSSTLDRDLRLHIYRRFLEAGYPPSVAEMGAVFEQGEEAVLACLGRLAEARAIVLDNGGRRIVSAPPFSALPTPFWVETPHGSWWAPCAWEALGIAALLGCDAKIHTSAGAVAGRLLVKIEGGAPRPPHLLVHIAVPAKRWWEDVRYTCSTILFFDSEGEIDAWCQARGMPRGAVLSIHQCWQLAQTWFTGRFEADWRRLTREESEKSLRDAGLDGPFWDLA